MCIRDRYPAIQKQYGLTPSVQIESPDPFVMANLFTRDDGSEIYFFTNAHLHNSHSTRLVFPKEATRKNAWVWDLDNGERYRLPLDKEGAFVLDLGPADSRMIVFEWLLCRCALVKKLSLIHISRRSAREAALRYIAVGYENVPRIVRFSGRFRIWGIAESPHRNGALRFRFYLYRPP